MITVDKLKIYSLYKGDMEEWICTDKDQSTITPDEWFLIDSLLQDITLTKAGKTSERFAEQLHIRIKDHCENIDAIKQLMNLS